jgi:hypothetical protein
MASAFCSKMGRVLSEPPQNFLLNDYYENLLTIFKQKINSNNKKTCIFLLSAFGDIVSNAKGDLIKCKKMDTLIDLASEL